MRTARLTGDKIFLGLIAFLLFFGALMIYNATIVFAQNNFGEAYRFVFLHIGWVSVGLLVFFFFYNLDYKKLYYIATPLFFATLLPLVLLSLIGLLRKANLLTCESFIFTPCVNGVTRWFSLNPFPLPQIPLLGTVGFQPSELAKFSLILFLSALLSAKSKDKVSPFISFITYTGLTSFLIFLQPNLSTSVLVFGIGSFIYFASGNSLKQFLLSLPVLFLLAGVLMMSSEYRRQRVLTYFGSNTDSASNYHVEQVNLALGSGGIFGKGLGQSRQKFNFLPEVTSDSIFAIIGEELGFVGTSFFILLFTYFLYRGLKIAKASKDDFGMLLGVGVMSWLGIQYAVNVSAMVGLIPLTGVPLPLVSYGGSSTIFVLAGLGIVAQISKHK
jgi:cell division protein FtsW